MSTNSISHKTAHPQKSSANKERDAFLKPHGLAGYGEVLGITYHNQAETSQMLGFIAPAGGWRIPYFDIGGKLTGFYRIRFDDYIDPYAATGRKFLKYASPRGSHNQIYFAPIITGGVNWRSVCDGTSRLLLVEGELKSASAVAHGFACIGLGGVYAFGDKHRGADLLAEFDIIDWKDRQVYIVFDSDIISNSQVELAEFRLASLLTKRGAHPHCVRLPSGPNGKKAGLDDFLL